MSLLETAVIVVPAAFLLGGGTAWFVLRKFRAAASAPPQVTVHAIAERVRSVGKLVGLEVCAKEIATATSGWAWLPPLLLSQARLAMIFHFEKQYTVDLAWLGPHDVTELPGGSFRVTLPPVRGSLRLIDVTPYDIQNARVLGLLDVIPMTADRQRALMSRAQQEAAELFGANDARYAADARASVERHLRSLLNLFGVGIQIAWREAPAEPAPAPLAMPEVAERAPALALAC